MYSIYATETFKKLYESLDSSEKKWIDKIKDELKEYPTGKPLGYNWFKEKKHLNKRLYFLIDENSKRILFVAFATKKQQQEVINFIKLNKDDFLNYLKGI